MERTVRKAAIDLTDRARDWASARDVRPILQRRADSIWARVEQARDSLCAAMERSCRDAGFRPLVIKSGPYVQPAWVKLESWVPEENGATAGGVSLITQRRSAVLTIRAREFHRYELEYTLELEEGGRKKAGVRLHAFGDDHADQLARFVLLGGPRPRFHELRLRRAVVELWRPANKADVLRRDWAMLGAWSSVIVGFLTLSIGIGVLLLLGGAFALHRLRQRNCVVRSSGKPDAEPRVLHRVDSWQAVISGLGDAADDLRDRFQAIVGQTPMSGLRCRVEKIWYWGLDGTVEREQIVLSLRRAIVFCQIHRYDDELYVGWDGHLNSGQWVEKTTAQGLDRGTGVPTQVKTVEPGHQALNQYDITDLNCLMELVHAKLVKLVKDLMDERRIDQEIDFTILRGERQSSTEGRRPEGGAPDGDRGLRKLLRTG